MSYTPDYDPNGVGQANGNLYGLPFSLEEAKVVIIPIPWDVTVSYADGCAQGPKAILEASPQLDLFDPDISEAWNIGLAMQPIDEKWADRSSQLRKSSSKYIKWLEHGAPPSKATQMLQILGDLNEKCGFLLDWVTANCRMRLQQGKLVGILGGDHSSPLGLMTALSEQHDEFGILQIDAHMDLRDAYEGFTFSHASIMYNALKLPAVKQLTQVGIRDYCEAEAHLAQEDPRIHVYYDRDLKRAAYRGEHWATICDKLVSALPQKVYISFDIDGLDPKLCPNTGTPVPGGLEFEQAMYLIEAVVRSGRTIIGFDLCEVSPGKKGDWDANVGARVLYRLANQAWISQG
ncbi:MAG: agmatinase family protein [Bacteroidia bacterium]